MRAPLLTTGSGSSIPRTPLHLIFDYISYIAASSGCSYATMSDNKGKYRTEIQQVRAFGCVISFAIVCDCDCDYATLDPSRITMEAMFRGWIRAL